MVTSELRSRLNINEDEPLCRFLNFLKERRNGSILLAWRLDLDKNSVGQVSHADFGLAMRRMGVAAETRSVWDSLRPDGSTSPLYFHELAPREAANLEDFATTLWKEVGFEFDHAWSQYIDVSSRRVATTEEFVRGVRRLGFQGNAHLLFRGFDMSGPNSMLTRRDFESMRGLALELVRIHHGQEATRQLQAMAQELGDRDFSRLINFSNGSRKGNPAGESGSMPVAAFATSLRALGFQGDCLAAAASLAKGSNGQMVSASVLRVLVTGDPSSHTGSSPEKARDIVGKAAKSKTRIEPGTVSDLPSPRSTPQKPTRSSPAGMVQHQSKATTAQLKASLDIQMKPTLAELRPKGVHGLKGLNAAHGGGFKSGTPLVIVDVNRGGATPSASSRKRPGSSSPEPEFSSSTGFSSSSGDSSDGSSDGEDIATGSRRHRRGQRGVGASGGSGGVGQGTGVGSHRGHGLRGGLGQSLRSGGANVRGQGGGGGVSGQGFRGGNGGLGQGMSGRRQGSNGHGSGRRGGAFCGEGGTGGGGCRAGSSRRSPHLGDNDSGDECSGGFNCKEGGSSSSRGGRRRISAGTGEVSDGTGLHATVASGCTGGTPRLGYSRGQHRRHSTGSSIGRSSSGERRREERRRSLDSPRAKDSPRSKDKERRNSITKEDKDKAERRNSIAKEDNKDESKDEDSKSENGKGEKGKGKGKGKGKKGKGDGETDEATEEDKEANDEHADGELGKGEKGKGKGKKGGPPPAPGEKGKDGKGKDGKGKDGKGKGQEPRKPELKPPVVLKKLFWTSFRLEKAESESPPKTVWDAIEKDGVEISLEDLNVLFKDEPPGPSKSSQPKDEPSAPKGRQRLQVLENQRRRQICVMQARLPGLVDTKNALQDMSQDKLTKDQVELLLMNVPSQEEVQLMQQAKQDHANDADSFWDAAEEFVLTVMEISQLQLRLQVWDFENNFQERFDDILSNVTVVEKGCNSVLNATGIRRLLSLVLYAGNYLNAGTTRGRADGFSLDTLSKMRSVKMSSSDRSGTLVDYIVQQMERMYPAELEAIFLPGHDADCIKNAARPKIEDLAEDTKSFRRAVLETLNRVRQAREKGDDDEDVFLQHSEILSMSDVELEELQGRVAGLKTRQNAIFQWFHMEGESSKMTLDEFFGIWDKFLGDIKAARKDYQALERKREAQARQEKLAQERQASVGQRKEASTVAKSRNSSVASRPASVDSRPRSVSSQRNIRRNFPSTERKAALSVDSPRKSITFERVPSERRKSFSAATVSSERRSIAQTAAKRASLSALATDRFMEKKRASLSLDKRRSSLPARGETRERRRSLPNSPETRSSFGMAMQLRYSAPPTPQACSSPGPRGSLSADSSPNVQYRPLQLDMNRRSVRLRTNESFISFTSDAAEALDSPRSRGHSFSWTPSAVDEAQRSSSSSSRPQSGAALWQAAVKQIIANRNTLFSSVDRDEMQRLGRRFSEELEEDSERSLELCLSEKSTDFQASLSLDSSSSKTPHVPPIDIEGAVRRVSKENEPCIADLLVDVDVLLEGLGLTTEEENSSFGEGNGVNPDVHSSSIGPDEPSHDSDRNGILASSSADDIVVIANEVGIRPSACDESQELINIDVDAPREANELSPRSSLVKDRHRSLSSVSVEV